MWTEFVVGAAAAGIPCIIFSIFQFLQMRDERRTARDLTGELMWHIGAKGPREVAEAKAVEAYEEEALRQRQTAFDNFQRQDADFLGERDEDPKPRQRIVDEQGNEYEVLAGMD